MENKYIVVSEDGKWFFTGKSYFSDNCELAEHLSIDDAKTIISEITIMDLKLRKVA